MKVKRILRKFISSINIEMSSKIMYRIFMHKKLNIKNPKTFNEKLCWLKLNTFPNDSKVIKCADKYLVRDYIKEKGYEELLINLKGVWDSSEEINWETLPDKFVLKCTHGCAYNIICSDKNLLDIMNTQKKLKKWLKEDFGLVSGEPHYSKIKRRIICESFLEGEIRDYKFFCFNGIPKFYYVAQTPNGDFHNMSCDFFWPNGEKTNFYRLDHNRLNEDYKKNSDLDSMLDIAKCLSSDFPFVRVDLMYVNNKIYFSELTFTPSAGMMPLGPEGVDEKLGEFLDLNQYVKYN